MNSVTLTILVKAIGMVLCFLGGIAQIVYGYRVFRDRKGKSTTDSAIVSLGALKFRAGSTGAVMMCTAAVWALFGVWMSPNLEQNADTIRVFSVSDPNLAISVPQLSAAYPEQLSLAMATPDQLKDFFREAYQLATNRSDHIRIGSKAADLDLSSLEINQLDPAHTQITTTVRSENRRFRLTYESLVEGAQIRFVPASAHPLGERTP